MLDPSCGSVLFDSSVAVTLALLDQITDAVFLLDARRRIAHVNDAAATLTRRAHTELIGADFSALLAGLVGTAFAQWERAAGASGMTVVGESRAPALDTWLELRVGATGAGYTAFLRDTGERKRAEAVRGVGAVPIQELVRHISDIVTVTDAVGTIRYESPSITSVLGYTPEELIGTNAYDLIHPDDRAILLASAPSALGQQGHSPAVVCRIRARDGSWRTIESITNNLLADPAVRGLVITARDITARREAEAALSASQARLAEAQRLAHLGSWEWDIARDTLHWSDETYTILGHTPQSFAPTHERMLEAIHPDDRDLIMGGLAASLAGHAPDSLDHRVVRPDGEVRVVHQRAGILNDEFGRPIKQVGIMLDITERRALESQLSFQAFHDPLTGLPNRALFSDRLAHALAQARQAGVGYAVLFLDLDNFKQVNDTYGHDVGDRLLVAVAQRLQTNLRAGDTLARLGGDEFTVLLKFVAGVDDATRAAARLLEALAAPFALGQYDQRVNTSIGVVLLTPEYTRPEELLRDADVALYRAKEEGRGRYALFDPAMQAAMADRLALERELWLALERNEFALHYQPIVSLRSTEVVEVEALLRWHNPARGWVSPAQFIPVAEACGAIGPLGRWVLQEACRQGRAWLDAYPDRTPVPIAVNLSAREFQDGELSRAVRAALRDNNLPASLLRLEITETAAMENAEASVRALNGLRGLGVRLAIDDFGTGYSSLAYLRQFPVDALKIDRSFIAELSTDRRSLEICRSIAMMAKTLRLEITAEGIETAHQAALARSFLCERAQGYYFGRPMPPDELAARVHAAAPPTSARTARPA